MVKLFGRHSVRPVKEEGESERDAEKRIRAVIEDATVAVTLQMREPERIKLKWEKAV